jgi:hypothetical protein
VLYHYSREWTRGEERPMMATQQTITLSKSRESVYRRYHGDTDVALVVDGVCVRSWVNGQTGAMWQSFTPDRDPLQGLSVADLKARGFDYSRSNAVYRDAAGNTYCYDSYGGWLVEDTEVGGDWPVEATVVVVGEE